MTNASLVPPAPSAGAGSDQSKHYRAAIRAFGEVASALREGTESDALLHLIAREMSMLIGVSRCSVYLRDEDSGLYRGQVGHAARDIDPLVKRLVGGADRFTQEIVRTKGPVVLRDAPHDQRAPRAAMRVWGVRSMMGVPMVLRDQVIGIFFLDSEEMVHHFSDLDEGLASAFAELAAVAVSQAQLLEELRSSNEAVTRRNQALRRAASIDDRLTGLVIRGESLPEIAEVVTELTGKPCAIYDAERRHLTGAGSDELPPPDLRPGAAAPEELVTAIDEVASGQPDVVGPFPRLGLLHRLLIAPVTVHDAHLATLVLIERGGRFNDFDALIARRVASIVALEMSAERRAAAAEWSARTSLASHLIRGNRDIVDVERRARLLGVRLDAAHVLSLVGARGGEEVPIPDAETLVEAVVKIAPGTSVLATGTVEGIAMIVELPSVVTPAVGIRRVGETIEQACASLNSEGRLIASLSGVCADIGDYERAYEEARQVLACMASFSAVGGGSVLSAQELGPGRLLLASAEPEAADRYADQVLGALLAESAPSELLPTVVCFFANDRSVRGSAGALGVHENTIRYRLAKVTELTGLDVASDSDDQFSVQIALLILRLRGALPAPPDHPSEIE